MINIAVLGHGNIGKGVLEVLKINKDLITEHAGEEIQVSRVLSRRHYPGDPVEEILTLDMDDILNDDSISIVVEVIGGTDPAYTYVKSALEHGKNVVTSNKALVAAHGPELIETAKAHNVNFMFEASVGGGIPIIRPLQRCLAADDILEISGILNGTTNFILTKMYNEGSAFDETLKEAQRLGYAEADPSADIEGDDPSRKISILASLACRQFVDYHDIHHKGIAEITATDIAFAKAIGRKIKLFASMIKSDAGVSCEVGPVMIGPDNSLYTVDGVKNGIIVRGNMLGDITFLGAGAGMLPTASSVVSDILVQAGHLHHNVPTEMKPEKVKLVPAGASECCYFIRTAADISDEAQKLIKIDQKIELADCPDDIGFITKPMLPDELDQLRATGFVRNIIKLK